MYFCVFMWVWNEWCHLYSVQETDLVVQALRLNTMSKLTFADISRFDALVKDVFSGVHFTNLDDQILVHALEEAYKEAQLELIPSQVRFSYGICLVTEYEYHMNIMSESII